MVTSGVEAAAVAGLSMLVTTDPLRETCVAAHEKRPFAGGGVLCRPAGGVPRLRHTTGVRIPTAGRCPPLQDSQTQDTHTQTHIGFKRTQESKSKRKTLEHDDLDVSTYLADAAPRREMEVATLPRILCRHPPTPLRSFSPSFRTDHWPDPNADVGMTQPTQFGITDLRAFWSDRVQN